MKVIRRQEKLFFKVRMRRQNLYLVKKVALIIGGFFVPPLGSIDGSILTAIGELFLWPALAFGAKALSEGKKAKFKKGDTTLEVGELDGECREDSESGEGREYGEGSESDKDMD